MIARHYDQNVKRSYTSLDFTGHIDCFKKNILADEVVSLQRAILVYVARIKLTTLIIIIYSS